MFGWISELSTCLDKYNKRQCKHCRQFWLCPRAESLFWLRLVLHCFLVLMLVLQWNCQSHDHVFQYLLHYWRTYSFMWRVIQGFMVIKDIIWLYCFWFLNRSFLPFCAFMLHIMFVCLVVRSVKLSQHHDLIYVADAFVSRICNTHNFQRNVMKWWIGYYHVKKLYAINMFMQRVS